jgi:hypothetical protein
MRNCWSMSRSQLRKRSRWRWQYSVLQYYVHQTCSVLLHYDSSKRCVRPLYKFVYFFKVVKLFLKHPIYYFGIPPLMIRACSRILRMASCNKSRSQWPRGLRHEMSSPAWTLGSWVRIPLESWMFVCVCFVFVLSCVGSGLATGWSPVQGILPIVHKCKIKNPHKRRPRPDMGCSAEEEEVAIKTIPMLN